MSPKLLSQIGPFKLKNCQEPYFCMRNRKKVVSERSVDPPDSNMGGFYRYRRKTLLLVPGVRTNFQRLILSIRVSDILIRDKRRDLIED
jgi:hypothetical protein